MNVIPLIALWQSLAKITWKYIYNFKVDDAGVARTNMVFKRVACSYSKLTNTNKNYVHLLVRHAYI